MADTLVCSIELSKIAGITVKVQNESGKITQTIHMNGTSVTFTVEGEESKATIVQTAESVTTEVEGPEETSTITQTQDRVQVKCKAFEVLADTVTMKSTSDTTHESGKKFTVTSDSDMSLSSSAKLDMTSTGKMTLGSSDTLDAKATADATLSGKNVTVKGQMNLTLEGGLGAKISATNVDMSAKAKMDLAGALTTVGKDLTTVRGSLVKVEGMVKLG